MEPSSAVTMRKLGIGLAGLALAAGFVSAAAAQIIPDASADVGDQLAYEYREAPRIMLDPSADNTDLY
jgi:hypothetical protein